MILTFILFLVNQVHDRVMVMDRLLNLLEGIDGRQFLEIDTVRYFQFFKIIVSFYYLLCLKTTTRESKVIKFKFVNGIKYVLKRSFFQID